MGIKKIFKGIMTDICVEGLNMDEQKVYKILNRSEIRRKEREKAAKKIERAEKNRQKREAMKIEQARRAEQMRIEGEKRKKQLEEQMAMRQAEIDSRNRYILDKYKYSGWSPETSFPEEEYNKISESIKNLKDEITKNAIANGQEPEKELATSVELTELIQKLEKWVMERAHARVLYTLLKLVARDYSIISEGRIVDIPDDRFLEEANSYINNQQTVEYLFRKGYAFNYYKKFPEDPISSKKAMSLEDFAERMIQISNKFSNDFSPCNPIDDGKAFFKRICRLYGLDPIATDIILSRPALARILVGFC